MVEHPLVPQAAQALRQRVRRIGLAEAIALLPKDVFRPETKRVTGPTLTQSFPAPEHVKPNAYTIVNGQVAIKHVLALRIADFWPAGVICQDIENLLLATQFPYAVAAENLSDPEKIMRDADLMRSARQVSFLQQNMVGNFL